MIDRELVRTAKIERASLLKLARRSGLRRKRSAQEDCAAGNRFKQEWFVRARLERCLNQLLAACSGLRRRRHNRSASILAAKTKRAHVHAHLHRLPVL